MYSFSDDILIQLGSSNPEIKRKHSFEESFTRVTLPDCTDEVIVMNKEKTF